ncbi:MAG: M48 family metalloprotease [Ignavibacteriaceae bacterium]|nr:M48 family metalloprotease [Ignavibacteriaceae bacterium]
MNKFRLLILSFTITFSSLFIVSCDKDNNIFSDINIFSDADDVELGQQVVTEINANPGEYPRDSRTNAARDYIRTRIFNHILQSPKVAKKNVYQYSLEIVKNDSVYNAFALPGGPVYVYTGLLKYLDSEAALAGVLGHEIAHAERRHATQRMTAYYGVSVLLSLILGQNPTQLAEIAANLFVGIAFLANSRTAEDESDQYSFEYLKDTRYYPGAVKFFFEKLRDDGLVSSQSSQLETFLSTHPDPIQRIANTNQRLTNASLPVHDWKYTGDGIFKTEYTTNIKNTLP